MAVSAQVYVRHPDLALADTIRSLPEADIGVVSDASTDPYNDAYFFWVRAPDFEAVEAALAADHTVAEFSRVAGGDRRQTYRIDYSPEATLISPLVADAGAVTVESRSHRKGWLLELRLESHDGLYELSERTGDRGIKLDVLELQQTDPLLDQPDLGLTDAQREALVAAFVNGYYDEPRETFLDDLADILDISPTAVSGRLRRGSARLVGEVLVDDE
ncbi:MAG: helix-turn-helix domain-containing protein [Halobacteriaceae archaeon]